MLRSEDNFIFLSMDYYDTHALYKTMKLLKENRIIVIGMPTHTSHIVEPLDFSVFSTFKASLSKEFRRLTLTKKIVDAFEVSNAISLSHQAPQTVPNIKSGLSKSRAPVLSAGAFHVRQFLQLLAFKGKVELV